MALHSKCLGPTGQARRVCGWHSRPPLLPCIVSARQPRNLAACAQTQGAANRSLPAQIPVDSFLPESDLYYEEVRAAGHVMARSTKHQALRPCRLPATVRQCVESRCCCSWSVQAEFVRLGQVLAPFGARGEVRVEISTDNPRKRFAKGSRYSWIAHTCAYTPCCSTPLHLRSIILVSHLDTTFGYVGAPAHTCRVFFRPPPLKGLLANSVQQEEEGLLHEVG